MQNKSLEAAEVCLRRGHLSQISRETVSLLRDHFAKGYCVGAGGGAGSRRAAGESFALLPRAKALEMSAKIEAALEEQNRRSRDVQDSSRRKSAVVSAAAATVGGERADSALRAREQRRGKQQRKAVDDGLVGIEAESADDSEDSIFQTDTRRSTRRRRQKKRLGEGEVESLSGEKQQAHSAGDRRTTSREARGPQKRRRRRQKNNRRLRWSGESSEADGEKEMEVTPGQPEEQEEEGDEKEQTKNKGKNKAEEDGASDCGANDEADDGQKEGSDVTTTGMMREPVVAMGSSGSAFPAGTIADNRRLPWRPGGRGDLTTAVPTLGVTSVGEGRNGRRSLRTARQRAGEKESGNGRVQRAARRRGN